MPTHVPGGEVSITLEEAFFFLSLRFHYAEATAEEQLREGEEMLSVSTADKFCFLGDVCASTPVLVIQKWSWHRLGDD